MAAVRKHLKGQTHAAPYRNMKQIKGKHKLSVVHRSTKVGKKTFGKSKHKNSRKLGSP